VKNKLKIAMVALVLLSGCSLLFNRGAKSQETHKYILDYKPTLSAARKQRGAWPVSVRMVNFNVAQAYQRNEIVYRQSEHEMHYYDFELWAVKPEYVISDMVFRHWNESKLFRELNRSVGTEEAEYILQGDLISLEEVDVGKEWFSHLALTMQLRDSQTAAVLWSRSWDTRNKVSKHDAAAVVNELSLMLQAVMDEAVADMDSVMTKKFPNIASNNPAISDTISGRNLDLPTPK